MSQPPPDPWADPPPYGSTPPGTSGPYLGPGQGPVPGQPPYPPQPPYHGQGAQLQGPYQAQGPYLGPGQYAAQPPFASPPPPGAWAAYGPQPYGGPPGYYSEKTKVAAGLLQLLPGFFLAIGGIGRCYSGHVSRGVTHLVLSVVGWLLSPFGIGLLLVGASWLWAVIDGIVLLAGRPTDPYGRLLR